LADQGGISRRYANHCPQHRDKWCSKIRLTETTERSPYIIVYYVVIAFIIAVALNHSAKLQQKSKAEDYSSL
jgi:hypothetical protein